MIRRTLARPDPEALAAATGAWLADRGRHDRRRRAVAVDGTTLRGAKRDNGRHVHLLAATDHTTRAVLAQRQVDGAGGEVPAFQPLLADLDLAGTVITADAAQTHAAAARVPGSRHAGARPGHGQGQPAHAGGPLRPPGVASRARARPHP
jgi:hypothetical protein